MKIVTSLRISGVLTLLMGQAPVWPSTAPEPVVAVTQGWVREAPPGMAMQTGYLVITNKGTHDLTLKSISSPSFKDVQMHVSIQQNGMESMKQVTSFRLPKSGTLTFRPGGNHLMLMSPTHPLKRGDRVPFTLHFGKDGEYRTSLTLKSGLPAPAPAP
jgi:copper(I)-binding protein